MTTTPDPQTVRAIMRTAAYLVANTTRKQYIVDAAMDAHGVTADDAQADEIRAHVAAAIEEALARLPVPDEQPQDAQPERDGDGDVRAVAALLIEDEADLEAHWDAVRAIRDRFAERIAALDAREAKAGDER